MVPVAQRQCVFRPLATHSVAKTRRCRPTLLPLAAASPAPNSSTNVANQHTLWSWRLFRATMFATTLQFCAAAGQAANASVGGGYGAGGGLGISGGGGGGGGDGPSSATHSSANVLGDVAEATELVEEVVLLDVGGMKCGGCVGHVKKILEAQPGVTSASVNLTTETALVRVMVPRGSGRRSGVAASGGAALAAMGEQLAKALSAAGFPSKPRDPTTSSSSLAAALAAKRAAKVDRLRAATVDLVVAWGLAAVCSLGHLAHAWPAAPPWMHALHSVPLNAALSVAALLGPGREILVSGLRALSAGRPDMNTLVGLGAGASFGVSCVAAALPGLGWKTFFEEPAMLLGFVLIGRALEERAKLQASADMAALQELVPSKARLVLSGDKHAEVPAEAVGPGDLLLVLPGDRVPVDGVVVAGRSAVDESALTGEPLPLTKKEGDKVTAGTVNCDGSLRVRAEHSGQHTVIADIVRMVEMAQARTAPIQRLADTVAGKFAYGVMGLSAATFAFWVTVGTRMFPQVLASCAPSPAASLLLSLQLAANVLVTACPCALGLATPTAVLVGTSAGARRGLLIRGGDILEATSRVDTVVLDKTGTLTVGRPQVTAIHTLLPAEKLSSSGNGGGGGGGDPQHLLLQLAAAVERYTSHPVARAVVAAADSAATTRTAGPTAAGRANTDGESSAAGAGITGSGAAAAGGLGALERPAADTMTARASGSVSGTGDSAVAGSAGEERYGTLTTGAAAGPLDLTGLEGSFVQEPGSGVAAVVGGRRVAVGTLDWLQRQGADVAAAAASLASCSVTTTTAAAGADSGPSPSGAVQGVGNSHSRVYVAVDGAVAGVIDVADAVRPDARETVDRLHRQGIRTVMLSGDKAAAAAEVAAAVGIAPSDVFADVKPAGKKAVVEELRAGGRVVAMVGDGINDTAALAAADVGVAMGGGVDAASEVAKVVLMGDQLSQVADAVHLAKRTLSKINQNLVWAFGYNLITIPLAAGALLPSAGICLTPSISGALMGMSSVAVVTNSLLLQLEMRAAGPAGAAGGAHSVSHNVPARAVPLPHGSVVAAGGASTSGGGGAMGDSGTVFEGVEGNGERGRMVPPMLASVVGLGAASGPAGHPGMPSAAG